MLIPSQKYDVEEISLNPYRYVSILRITSLQADDFDVYKCVSKNTIGKSEAVIDVFGKYASISQSNRVILFIKKIILPFVTFFTS